MVSRPQTLQTPLNPRDQSGDVSGYEQCRQQRIKENMERMQKLGIFDLSSKLKSKVISTNRPQRKPFETKTSGPPRRSSRLENAAHPYNSLHPRRSSRLQNVTPVSYMEKREEEGSRELGSLVEEGERPEIYTEEQEKLLGTCEGTWTLFVDGYGKDGKRIYDPVKGKTCHQCRQKTLGHRTHCSKCQLVQGQFCGDCLYMRYGEHVLEVNQNPDWICPVCRGICNCSLCRQAKGWPATGTLYRRITKLGFKSVAHYLIQTRRAETISGDAVTDETAMSSDAVTDETAMSSDAVSDETVLGKRSLDFALTKKVAEQNEHFIPENGQDESPKHESEDNFSDELGGKKEEPVDSIGVHAVRAVKEESLNEHMDDGTPKFELAGTKVEQLLAGEHGNLMDGFINKRKFELEGKEELLLNMDGVHDVRNVKDELNEHGGIAVVSPASPENPESKRRKLRPRCNKSDESNSSESESELEKEVQVIYTKCRMNSVLVNEPNSDSISGRLRQRRKAARGI